MKNIENIKILIEKQNKQYSEGNKPERKKISLSIHNKITINKDKEKKNEMFSFKNISSNIKKTNFIIQEYKTNDLIMQIEEARENISFSNFNNILIKKENKINNNINFNNIVENINENKLESLIFSKKNSEQIPNDDINIKKPVIISDISMKNDKNKNISIIKSENLPANKNTNINPLVLNNDSHFNFSSISNIKEMSNLNNNKFPILNNNKSIKNPLTSKNIYSENKDNQNSFLKPKDISTPIAHMENKDDHINFGNLSNSFSFNNPNNNNGNNSINFSSLANSHKNYTQNSEVSNHHNNPYENSTNKHSQINFSQLSSLNFLKNPIERGTPVNLNTISSIHSNNHERNHTTSNMNFEYLLKNYNNLNQNVSNFANGNNILNNYSNLNNIYNLNNLVNTANNDNNNIINLISQSPRNIEHNLSVTLNNLHNLNNSLNNITSPKNLVNNLMPNNNNNNLPTQNSDFFNFMNLSSFNAMSNNVGSTPISQNISCNYNNINNPLTPSGNPGFLNLSEISKYKYQFNSENINNLNLQNPNILNYCGSIGNKNSNGNSSINNQNSQNNNIKTPITILKNQLNEINHNGKLNQNTENRGDETNVSVKTYKSFEEINQIHNSLINKLSVIKQNNPEFYKECCINYQNLIQDPEKRIYTIMKIVCDYDRLYPDNTVNKILNFKNFPCAKPTNISTKINNSVNAYGTLNNPDDLSSKNIHTLTNMNSTNNITSCKSSPWLNAGNINSFGDLAKNYFNNVNNKNKNCTENFNDSILTPKSKYLFKFFKFLDRINSDFLNISQTNETINHYEIISPMNSRNNNHMMNLMVNIGNLSNICSPISMNTGNNLQSGNIKTRDQQPTFSDFVRNISNKTE